MHSHSILLISFSLTSLAIASKVCLVPTRRFTPWTKLEPEEIICPMNEMPIPPNSSDIFKGRVEIDTTDIFSSLRIMATSSKLVQYKTCCTTPTFAWSSNRISHDSFVIETAIDGNIEAGTPHFPDPVCSNRFLEEYEECRSKVFKVDQADTIFYSAVHGFPPNLKCDIDRLGVITCFDQAKLTTYVGTFPSRSKISKNCPVESIGLDAIIYDKDNQHFVDFTDIRVEGGRVVCVVSLCKKKWYGLSNGMLMLSTDSYLNYDLPKCEENFNYKFDISMERHEEIKEGLKALKSNENCEIIKRTKNKISIMEHVILEWDAFYPLRPGIHQSIKVDNLNLYKSTRLFELLPLDSVQLKWVDKTAKSIFMMDNGTLSVHDPDIPNWESFSRIACSEKINLTTSIKVKELIRKGILKGEEDTHVDTDYVGMNLKDNWQHYLKMVLCFWVLFIVLIITFKIYRCLNKNKDRDHEHTESTQYNRNHFQLSKISHPTPMNMFDLHR